MKFIETAVFRKVMYLLIALMVLIALISNINTQHYSDQTVIDAESLLSGHWDMIRLPSYAKDVDMAIIDGKYYWTMGILPSVAIVPFWGLTKIFVLSPQYAQSLFSISLLVLNLILVFHLSRRYSQSYNKSLLLAFAFCFASTYTSIAYVPLSYHLNQLLTITLSLLALIEYSDKSRYWLIGSYLGLIILTRPSAAILIVFFLVVIMSKNRWEQRFESIFQLVIPILISVVMIFCINHAKFGEPSLSAAYKYQNIGTIAQNEPFMVLRNRIGLFSLENIPTNFYWYFLSSYDAVVDPSTSMLKFPFIEANEYGLSFFLVAPFFIKKLIDALRSRTASPEFLGLLLSIVITLFFLLTFTGTGWYQYGPRYTSDFLPALLMALLVSKKMKLSEFDLMLIFISAFMNILLGAETRWRAS